MVVLLFAFLLVTVVPSVAGLHKIHPTFRQLQPNDDASTIAKYHNIGVDAVMAEVDSDSSFSAILEVLLQFMEKDDGIPEFSSEEMSNLVMSIFNPEEDGSVDFNEALMNETESLSALSPVMGVLYDVLYEEEYETIEEFLSIVNEAAENSGLETELVLAAIAAAVADASEQYWNGASDGRKLIPAWIKIIIADVIGALIGYLVAGLIGAILFGILASVLAALAYLTGDDDYFC